MITAEDHKTWLIENGYKPLTLKIINESTNEPPKYESANSSGFDIRANLTQEMVIKPNETAIIPTGIKVELPTGMELQIRSRSGIAAKNSVIVLNAPGTIDNDYRGEIKIILINHGSNPFTVNNGDRIAQGVVCPYIGSYLIDIVVADEITTTDRNENGFGSTGLK